MQQAGGSALTRFLREQDAKMARFVPQLPQDVKARLWKRADRDDKPLIAEVFARMPAFIAHRIIDEWERLVDTKGRFDSNRYLWTVKDDLLPELFPENGLAFHATSDEVADAAERAVRHLQERLRSRMTEADLLALLERIAHRYGVDLPGCTTLAGQRARMLDAAWWRRALRKRFQTIEHAAIKAGCVHRRAAPYVSDEAMRRHQRDAQRIAKLLESLEAVNETTGEILPLDEAAATSLANPEIRRVAMLACVKGLEARATELGLACVFLTITCPSRMHARSGSSGEQNPHYDGTSPRTAQNYLARKVWNAATRKLKRQGIDPGMAYFGLRVVEPHHDETPHWHLLAFVEPRHLAVFLATLRDYALKDSGNEPGAQEHRFKVVHIDPKKGSAVGYVAKYVSKSIDGHGVGEDLETGNPASATAARIVVCARLWHWRQFQFFGVGALTPFRELYRLITLPPHLDAPIGDLWRAARGGEKGGDFGAYLRAREAGQVRLTTLREARPSRRYPGEQAHRLRGIVFHGDAGPVPIVTRPDDWSIRPRPDASCRTGSGRVSGRQSAVDRRGFEGGFDRDRVSLGLDSITPRDIDYSGFYSAPNSTPNSRKSLSDRTAKHRQTVSFSRAKQGGIGVLQREIGRRSTGGEGERPRPGTTPKSGA